MASLQENRTVLNYLHPVSFFRNETCIADQMTKKSICSEAVFAVAREHSVCGFVPYLSGLGGRSLSCGRAAGRHEQRAWAAVGKSNSRAGIENMDRCMSCGLLNFVPGELSGEGAS